MSSECADAACAIGRLLARDALWHRGRCNWVGSVADATDPWRIQYRALGADLYGGTAGVGLALAHLAVAADDGDLRRAALGALRHALGAERTARDGFHSGTAGVAWAAARSAELLGEPWLAAGARRVLARLPEPAQRRRPHDLIGGAAGTVHGLLALGRVEAAATSGDSLLAAAHIDRHGWSWAGPGGQRLCGVSHGAAGIGWALSDLYVATGDARFRTAAAGALAFERSWRHAPSGTWPDLRIAGQRRHGPRAIAEHTLGTWCHGDAGAALARRHMRTAVGPDADVEAAVALATTARHVAASIDGEFEDLTLCHGLGGAADVLLDAAPESAVVARTLLISAAHRHGTRGRWPCGAAGEPPPGLFLGLAGIAWLLLRADDPSVPSPLAAVDVSDTSS
jgi:lantibiotic biosynthesis protein